MMECQELPVWAVDYHGGELSEIACSEYQEHLLECESCRQADEEYAEALGLLKPWPSEPPMLDDEAFLSQLNASLAPKTPSLPRLRQQPWWSGALAASILVLIGAFAWVDRPHAPSRAVQGSGWSEERLASLQEELDDESSSYSEEEPLEGETASEELAVIEAEAPEVLESGLWSEVEESWPVDSEGSLQESLDELSPQELEILLEEFEEV